MPLPVSATSNFKYPLISDGEEVVFILKLALLINAVLLTPLVLMMLVLTRFLIDGWICDFLFEKIY